MIQVGSRLGKYEITDFLGRGGMGDVWKGLDTALSRQVAIKVLSQALSSDEKSFNRFKREATSQGALNHPNIASVYAFEELPEANLLVLEYIEGTTLEDYLKERGTLAAAEALTIMEGILSGLEFAHSNGIIHRDIKPANIMITKDGSVKIMDFGISRRESDIRLTTENMSIGSPPYMSPEQFKGSPGDSRSDLYSFGILCYEMLAGSPPFVSDNAFILLKMHTEQNAQPLVNVDAALWKLIKWCLEKEPDYRVPSANEALKATRALKGGASTLKTPVRWDRIGWITGGISAFCFLLGVAIPVFHWPAIVAGLVSLYSFVNIRRFEFAGVCGVIAIMSVFLAAFNPPSKLSEVKDSPIVNASGQGSKVASSDPPAQDPTKERNQIDEEKRSLRAKELLVDASSSATEANNFASKYHNTAIKNSKLRANYRSKAMAFAKKSLAASDALIVLEPGLADSDPTAYARLISDRAIVKFYLGLSNAAELNTLSAHRSSRKKDISEDVLGSTGEVLANFKEMKAAKSTAWENY